MPTAKITDKSKELKFKLDKIEWWDIEKVIPYANNTKKHPQTQIDKIKTAIAEFGWDQPIVVDENGVIIKGHGRRMAALQMGLKQVPVVVRTDLSEAQKKAARISDNKVAESEWDKEMLGIELESLDEMRFDLNLTGLDDFEIDHLLPESDLEFQPPENLGGRSPAGDDGDKEPAASRQGNAHSRSDDSDEDEDDEDDEFQPPVSDVRMLQLFLDSKTHPEVMKMVEALNSHYQTQNPTDCVLAALREVYAAHSA